jgi:hypothetical protein
MRTPSLNTAAPTTVGVSFPSQTATVVPSAGVATATQQAKSVMPVEVGYTLDESVGETKVTIGQTDKEREEFTYNVSMYHRETPIHQGGAALDAIDSQLGKISKAIARERPELAKASWDFTVKDGKLTVAGAGISKEDKVWLEGKLNSNGVLTAAVSTYMKAATGYLETTEENPAYHGINYTTGRPQSYEFHDVKGQLEGVLNFKEIIGSVKAMYTSPDGTSATGYSVGYTSLEMLASRLAS